MDASTHRKLMGPILCGLAALLFLGAQPSRALAQDAYPGQLLSWEVSQEMSSNQVNLIPDQLASQLAPKVARDLRRLRPVDNGLKIYTITYMTPGLDDTLVVASGFVSIPAPANDAYPLVSVMHDTITGNPQAPSLSPDPATLYVFGGFGYVMACPDYLGWGETESFHPYFHARTLATTGRDMLRATRELCTQLGVTLNSKLLLTGYTEGGYATLALQRLLESDFAIEFPVTASAPLSPPASLTDYWDHLVKTRHYWDQSISFILSELLDAYLRIYDLNETYDSVFRPPFSSTVKERFDGNLDWQVFLNSLPTDPLSLVRKDFIRQVRKNDDLFHQALEANDVSQWAPKAPIMLFFGGSDKIVPPGMVQAVRRSLKRLKADVKARNSGGYLPHGGSSEVASYIEARKWFAPFLKRGN